MASPYQLAALSNAVYRVGSTVTLEDSTVWNRTGSRGNAESGPHGFYAAKYQCRQSGERIIAFRGSNDSRDWSLANISHFFERDSEQVSQALSFLREHHERNGIVTGHSLGGFLACTMSFHFPVRAVTFNAPSPLVYFHPLISPGRSFIDPLLNELEARFTSQPFRDSILLIYRSSTDVASTALPPHVARQFPNVLVRDLGIHGWHPIGEIESHLSRVGRFELHWPTGTRWIRHHDLAYIQGVVAGLCFLASSSRSTRFIVDTDRRTSRNRAAFEEGYQKARQLHETNRFRMEDAIRNYYRDSPNRPTVGNFSDMMMLRQEMARRIKRFVDEYPYQYLEEGWYPC